MAITDGSVVQISGAPADHEQVVIESTELTEFNDKLVETVAGTVTPIPATTSDLLPYVDSVTKEIHVTTVSSMFDNAVSIAIDAGSGASIVTSATPTALPIFDTGFYSSTPAITDTAGDLGITLGIPSRFRVSVTGQLQASNITDFIFQIFVGGVACGQQRHVSGNGNDKDVPFALQCVSQTVTPGDTAELRVSDDGSTLVLVDADLIVEFAGL
jgi:hypothetical protein